MTRDAEEAETPRERRRRGSGDAETRRDAEDRVASPLQRGALAGTWAFSLAVRTDDVQPGPPANTPGVAPCADAARPWRWPALGHFRWRSELTMYNQARLRKRPAWRRARMPRGRGAGWHLGIFAAAARARAMRR